MSAAVIRRVSKRIAEVDGGPVHINNKMDVPTSHFTFARKDVRGRKMPQAIAHRGYKAEYPENTMKAFEGAVKVGAHAVETDIHLTKDDVVVLSHDATLKRCFGRDEKIVDCDWSYLETLRTLKEPHEPMPRLKDLLEYMAQPGLEDIWILLDIKVPWPALMEPFQKNRIDKWEKLDNRVDDVMRLIGSTIAEVKPTKPWNQRVVLGCWAAKYLPYCTQYLPGFPITHIGFSVAYARQFLKVPNVSFNMLQKTMIGPLGNRFMRDCKRLQRPLYLWTVNDADWMKWSIKKGVDGVITDDPQKFLDVCKDYDDDIPIRGIKMRELPSLIWINLLILVFGFLFRLRYGFRIDLEKLHSDRQGSRPAMKLA